jgi:hypothetical protein
MPLTLLLSVIFLLLKMPVFAQQSSAEATPQGSPIPGMANFSAALGLNPAGNIQAVLVYEDNKLVQTLRVCTEEPVPRDSNVGGIDTADYNFDGYPDLALKVSAAKKNEKFCIWLFDPKTERYVSSPELSQLVNLRPDAKTGTVYSYTNEACMGCYEKRVYRWDHGQLALVKVESQTEDPLMPPTSSCRWVRTVQETKGERLVETGNQRVNDLGVPCLSM